MTPCFLDVEPLELDQFSFFMNWCSLKQIMNILSDNSLELVDGIDSPKSAWSWKKNSFQVAL